MFKDKIEEIFNFFDPVQLRDFSDTSYINDEVSVGNWLFINSNNQLPASFSKFEIALVFVDLDINNTIEPSSKTAQQIREQFYRLRKVSSGLRVADLGNLKTGNNINETLFSLQEVCSLLFHLKVNVFIIGGPQLLTLSCFKAFEEFENNINLLHVDSRLDFPVDVENIEEKHYLGRIIENEANHIYNIACFGYQTYFVDQKQIKRLNELYFEHCRLGEVRAKFESFEPVIRDSDLVSFDISAVRMGDAPGQADGSPNGFYADEACRIARYAGISDRVQTFGLYEIEAKFDQNKQTVKLASQIIWYYLEGYINRKHDFPQASLNDYTKYNVQIDEIDFPIVFYKSDKTDRWWLEVKSVGNQTESDETVVVSCTEDDYLLACKNEIPDRWWINFKKLK